MRVGAPRQFDLQVGDPAAGKPLRVQVSGSSFAVVKPVAQAGGVEKYLLSLSPSAKDGGSFILLISACDELGVCVLHKLELQVNN